VLLETIEALRFAAEPAWPPIELFLRHESGLVRGAALRFCASRLGREAIPTLLAALQDTDAVVIQSAIDELDEQEWMDDAMIIAIRPFLQHESGEVRRAAQWALRLDDLIYKIVSEEEWRASEPQGEFRGAAVDLADGFIHFSTAAQVEETARRHFAGQRDLLLVAVEGALLGDALKWEVSRGGDLFPHLYGPLQLSAAIWARPLPLRADGAHDFSGLLP
jgi:uncharacterized protein (DUF952 family)